jgi:uncharacterized RDD family membrane protein YckC
MRLECPSCQRVCEFTGPRPAFCSYCGQSLGQAINDPEATGAFVPDTGPASPPTGSHDDLETTREHPAGVQAGQLPETVGSYRLLRLLGQGGMGTVWEAEQAGTGRRVAVKFLVPDRAHAPDTLARFLREGRLAAALSHPRTTFIFEAGEQAGKPYIVMELMPGRTLENVVREQGALPVNRAVDYILDVIEGLEAAHALGIIHRDMKPSNCFLDSDGRAKVGDFGLSKSLLGEAALTQTGVFMGTPQYAAPEQVRGKVVDERTDVYAVGATLFYLLGARVPFLGDAAAVIAQIVSDPAPTLRAVGAAVPADLDRIVAGTLEKDPARRYTTLADLRRALLPFATGGTSIADVGRRLGAYTVDNLIVGLAAAVLGMSAGVAAHGFPEITESVALFQLVQALLIPAYFAVVEGRWGRGVGKLLLGLRVVAVQGQPAGPGRALVRAAILPGALGLIVAAPLFELHLAERPEAGPPSVSPQFIFESIALGLPTTVFPLLCLTSMRARNGYRGWHELASGTRVVRLRTAASRSRLAEVPIRAPASATGGPAAFGPYRVQGSLGPCAAGTILQARDDALHRHVWIYLRPSAEAAVTPQRMRVARPARLRWLQRGGLANERWDAFEAVLGAPLQDLFRHREARAWEHGRFVLLDLAEELSAAVTDGTLPSTLSLEQVWVDRGGHVKLLDAPIGTGTENATPGTVFSPSDAERTLVLLRTTADLCTRGQVLPGHAAMFMSELTQRPMELPSLAWAVQELRQCVERTATLRWDERLGVLGISMGLELSVVLSWAVMLPMLVIWQFPGMQAALKMGIVVALDVALAGGIAFALQGGPAFRVAGIEVRRTDGRRAGRWRCAWRNLLAWLPLLIPYSFLGWLLAKMTVNNVAPDGAGPPVFTPPEGVSVIWTVLLPLCGLECLGLLFVVGGIFTVLRPRRGLQDLLAGTCLVPR